MKSTKDGPFGRRLREAFEGASNSEIARKLAIGNSTVTDYVQGKSYPTAEGLVKIAEITKCNLHYLLTGKGESDLNPLRFLDEKVRALVEHLARADKTTVETVVGVLVADALVKRGSYLFSLYPRLRGRELDELRLLFALVEENADEEVEDQPRQAPKEKRA